MNKTIAKVGYAMLTETTEGTITYDKVKWFKSDKAGGRTVGAEPSGESTTVYADGLPVIVANNNAGYNISLELIAIVDDIEKDWYGNAEATEGGFIEKAESAYYLALLCLLLKSVMTATNSMKLTHTSTALHLQEPHATIRHQRVTLIRSFRHLQSPQNLARTMTL